MDAAVMTSGPGVRATALYLCLLPAGSLAGQDGPGLASHELLRRLRSRDLTAGQALELLDSITAQPVQTRLQASDVLRSICLDRQKSWTAAHARFGERCRALAANLQREQLAGRGAAAVDTLRRECAAISRRDDLTAETIRSELDPRVEQLRQLLLPTADKVLAAGAQPLFDALVAAHGEWQQWHDLYWTAVAGLELHSTATSHFARVPPPPPPPPADVIGAGIAGHVLAGAVADQDRKVLAANAALQDRIDAEELAGTTELNRLRWLLGLSMLRFDEKLGLAARDHSQDMLTLGFFSHSSPVAGKTTFGQRASRFGTSASSENIANGSPTGAAAIAGWWYSPGHHRNMLGGHSRTGLGRCEQLWTQLFGG